jgi:hypothetical protein
VRHPILRPKCLWISDLCSESGKAKKRLDMRYSVIVMYNTTGAESVAHHASEGGDTL